MKVYIETYGCWLNKGESSIVETIIRDNGGVIVDDIASADVVILNTCAIRGDTERKMLTRIKELSDYCSARNLKFIVMGCLVNVRPASITRIAPYASLIEPGAIKNIWKIINSDRKKYLVRRYCWERSILPKYNKKGIQYIVPVQTGCLGNCAFCIEPIARGRLHSYAPDMIVERVKDAVQNGAKEICITGQDVICYGLDIGTTLPELIKRILDEVDGEYFIRIGMLEPSLTLKYLDELIKIYKDERVFKYLHLPLQSGSNKVLKLMQRKYSVEDYIEIVSKFRKVFPQLNIATDIIVGFPGETEEDFNHTIEVLEEIKPDKTHVARYTIRPFTPAAKMKQVQESIKKKRSKKVTEIANKLAMERNLKHVGEIEKVLINSFGYNSTLLGRTLNYKPVVIPRKNQKVALGDIKMLKIISATPFFLLANP